MFHSSVSSKFRNLSRVTMAPPEFTRVSAPSTTCQPAGTESCLKPRHPAVVFPSNNRRQPPERSAAVNVLGAAGPLAMACWARLARGATIKAAAAQASSSRIGVTGIVTGFTSPPRLVGNAGQLLDPRLHGATSALALGNDKHRGEQLPEMRPDGRPGLGRRRVVRPAVRRGHLGEAQLADVPGEGRLGDAEPLRLEQLSQLLLTRDRLRAYDPQDGRMALGFHGARI